MKRSLTRRDFFKFTGKAAIGTGAVILAQAACKSPTSPDTSTQDVSVNVAFFNQTQGPLGEKIFQGISDPSFTIKISQSGFSGIDALRIAVRKAADRETMGKCIGFSKTGEIKLDYPEKNESWEAYLMNFDNNSDYQIVDYWLEMGPVTGRLRHGRNILWHREEKDGYTGPEQPILESVRQFNAALDYPWKRYGTLTQRTDAWNFGIGYGHCFGEEATVIWKGRTAVWLGVNPDLCQTFERRLMLFNTHLFGMLTATAVAPDSICDQNTGGLNPAGKDLLAYVYVKDENY